MARALLDINVLIALLDPDHVFHERAHGWWKAHAKSGWASCPLTENGVVRIMSNPNYSKSERFSPGELIKHLDEFSAQSDHEFWADHLSLRDKAVFARDHVHSSKSITDLYLLALVTKRRGCLATFDKSIPCTAVHGATIGQIAII